MGAHQAKGKGKEKMKGKGKGKERKGKGKERKRTGRERNHKDSRRLAQKERGNLGREIGGVHQCYLVLHAHLCTHNNIFLLIAQEKVRQRGKEGRDKGRRKDLPIIRRFFGFPRKFSSHGLPLPSTAAYVAHFVSFI